MNYKSTNQAAKILALQHSNGSWGDDFHTLSCSTSAQPMTTEQALRRLYVLGFTRHDEPILRALRYMERQLANPNPTVFIEKKHDSKTYGDLMLAAWLRLFEPENKAALVIAERWAAIIENAFFGGEYLHKSYVAAYEAIIGKKLNPKAGCLASFVVFYQVALLAGRLSQKTERAVLDYIINYPTGIMYIYDRPLCQLPDIFASKAASYYLAAIELLSGYSEASGRLGFVTDWLYQNRSEDGMWDMGAASRDNIYFPLSDSWRSAVVRRADCTHRISCLIERLNRSFTVST